jgi:hypothetical protein
MASKKDKEKIDIDMLYVGSITKSSSSMVSYVPPIILPPIYVPLLTIQYLFSIEKNHPQDKLISPYIYIYIYICNRPFIKELRTANKPLQVEKRPTNSKLNQ